MQAQLKQMAIFVVCTVTAPGIDAALPEPLVQINEREMPQYINGLDFEQERIGNSVQAIYIYHQLREGFGISNKAMGDWLGVKRRSLYNWMNDPQSAIKYGNQIEYRLDALNKLAEDMEPEHRMLLPKIAFSPIYGDPSFGEAILEGKDSLTLMRFYDKLFSRFESYRRTLKLINV